MSTLLIRLAGPLQSWGDSSRFTRRETRTEPTKSGVIGMLAAAQGRRRSDSLEDLLTLRFGVRVDQAGRLLRDFQTAQRWDTGDRMPLSYRYYLADAVFVAGVEGDASLLEGLDTALRAPAFPLFLGRRSCPPAKTVALGVVGERLEDALRNHPWEAAEWYRRTQPRSLALRLVTDAPAATLAGTESVRDLPRSYDPRRREYGWRSVVTDPRGVVIDNPDGRDRGDGSPDFFTEVAVG
ncbi:MAG: type I-E CRISPR-associated protein Cas5/CasD [Micrococcales bacterium]|nr:type I-E CRISPR-associated protein Cas5/CasD [Micrococcales bacterium]